MNKIKLAIADDFEKTRNSIVWAMKTEPDIEIVLQAENGEHLLEQLKTIVPDIILMDIRMPKMDGIEATGRVKELYPNIKIITYSQYDYEANIVAMYSKGVKSFIGKEDRPEELLKAIRTVYSGGAYMTDMAREIVEKNLSKLATKPLLFTLTQIESLLLKLLADGDSSTEIGSKLNKSPRTIEKHRDDLYKKFGVKSKEQLILEAVKFSLL